MPNQPVRPIVMSGNAVICLEDAHGLEVLNVSQNPKTAAFIPLTQEQRDVGMKTNLKGEVPMCMEAATRGNVVVLEEPLGFKNNMVRAANFKEISVPKCLIEAGPQCDQKVNLFDV